MHSNVPTLPESLKVKKLIDQLKSHKITPLDVPNKYATLPVIAKVERELGILKTEKRGFDVLKSHFFVDEVILSSVEIGSINQYSSHYFSDFTSFYNYLDGDIYNNACYFQYNFSADEIQNFSIDLTRINTTSFIHEKLKNIPISISTDIPSCPSQQIQVSDASRIARKALLAEFIQCETYDQFKVALSKFDASEFSRIPPDYSDPLRFFLDSFIFANPEKAFDIVIACIADGLCHPQAVPLAMCSIYDPQRVIDALHFDTVSNSTHYNRRNRIKEYIIDLGQHRVVFHAKNYFDPYTQFYCSELLGCYTSFPSSPVVNIYRYFDTFEEFVTYLRNDLSDCDLSSAPLSSTNFKKYQTNENTKYPSCSFKKLEITTSKRYDSHSDRFQVQRSYLGENQQVVKKDCYSFDYFFDFLYFLDYDLSNADLLECNGLKNLKDFSFINFDNALLQSSIMKKIGKPYSLTLFSPNLLDSFSLPIQNEPLSRQALTLARAEEEYLPSSSHIYYVTDLHLLHKIQRAHCHSDADVVLLLRNIILDLFCDRHISDRDILLFGGDTSSDFDVFCLFIKLLRQYLDEQSSDFPIVFILGNHELWPFSNLPLVEIYQKYETALIKQKMLLLQNNIIYRNNFSQLNTITSDELSSISSNTLRSQLRNARFILFGGTAFSGQNKEFNAENGIYRSSLNRSEEILESQKFEHLYKLVANSLVNHKAVILTHTPPSDWHKNFKPQKDFVYVNGHTHYNYFYDDGIYRIYADNQIGYRTKHPKLKYFYWDNSYDLFVDYPDGIHTITCEQFCDFYRGINAPVHITKSFFKIYLLKRNGYYCFIHQSLKGQLYIMHGGAIKKLGHSDIDYYYQHMNAVINALKSPMDTISLAQQKISADIISIGGTGTIHGCIIDIDYYNHIYVNPMDLTVTAYFATDMIHKTVFPDIPTLLKENCPALYSNYCKRLESSDRFSLARLSSVPQKHFSSPEFYLSTDIYAASRTMCKLQRLQQYRILSVWSESAVHPSSQLSP